ncbi:MAG TPA: hypothetical protein VG712_06075, partial [Gemmatimonadales bacterium]|nr:hypothetical protein [Gemmatimonadales bacterium]
GDLSELSGSATFRASGTHTTIFAGPGAQAISITGAGLGVDQFQNVTFANTAGVVLNSDIAAAGNAAITAGTLTGTGRTAIVGGDISDPTGAAWAPEFTQLAGSPAVLPDSFPANLQVTGAVTLPHSVAVHGTLSHSNGSLTLGGFTLRVDSTLTVSGAAQLRMQSAADSLIVGGSVTWGGSTTAGLLTAGTAVFRGDFSELSGSATYRASAGHTTVFAGSAPQTVSFTSPGLGSDQFQAVEFANPTSVTFSSGFAAAGTASVTAGVVNGAGQTGIVAGDLVDASGTAWRIDTTDLAGTTTALPVALARTLKVSGSVTLSNDVAVHGNLLQTNGSLVLNGHTLTVDSALAVSGAGQFRMQDPADSLDVAGATTWVGSTSVGLLTAGTAVFRGDFSELSGSSTYRASNTHRTVFAGTAAQSVAFTSPGLGGDQFQDVTFANPAGVSITDFAVAGGATVTDGPVAGPGTATLAGTVTDTANGFWRPELTTFTVAPAALPDSFARSVSLTGTVTLFKPLVVGGQLTVAGGVFTPNGYFVRADSGLSVTGSAQFVMGNAADSVEVTGTALWNGSTTGGLLTNGVLVLHGDLSAPSGSPTFQPSGAH